MKKKLNIIKIGGNIIDDEKLLMSFIKDFSSIKEPCILVHGGGKLATELSKKLNIEPKLIDGRRITDTETLDIVTMVYGGLINKNIVSILQSNNCNAIGLTGADANCIIAKKRAVSTIDFGFVGDINTDSISVDTIKLFIELNLIPVFSSITHDGNGQLLNTNADTIASVLSIALSSFYEVNLYYCFEKKGVLKNVNDENSLIPIMDKEYYTELKNLGIISDGMIPKIDNAFDALENGVNEVVIGHASQLYELINNHAGTRIK
jgi:acetylglutamate kinase